jgi:hypothetical protein
MGSRSPPLIALVGLLGMVLGEQAIEMVKHHFPRAPEPSIRQASRTGYRPNRLFAEARRPRRGGGRGHSQDPSRSLRKMRMRSLSDLVRALEALELRRAEIPTV